MVIPVKITEKALAEIQDILTRKNIPQGYGVRMGIAGGRGCAGVKYTLGFDLPNANDVSYEVAGVPVFFQKNVMMFLIGKQVDFYEGSDARGFIFSDEPRI
jgi:iron-sulfur cluster assembly protein